jgi:hypothetical protein
MAIVQTTWSATDETLQSTAFKRVHQDLHLVVAREAQSRGMS